METPYYCPKCKAKDLRRLRGRGRKVKNYQHFQCFTCCFGILSEYDPQHLTNTDNPMFKGMNKLFNKEPDLVGIVRL